MAVWIKHLDDFGFQQSKLQHKHSHHPSQLLWWMETALHYTLSMLHCPLFHFIPAFIHFPLFCFCCDRVVYLWGQWPSAGAFPRPGHQDWGWCGDPRQGRPSDSVLWRTKDHRRCGAGLFPDIGCRQVTSHLSLGIDDRQPYYKANPYYYEELSYSKGGFSCVATPIPHGDQSWSCTIHPSSDVMVLSVGEIQCWAINKNLGTAVYSCIKNIFSWRPRG